MKDYLDRLEDAANVLLSQKERPTVPEIENAVKAVAESIASFEKIHIEDENIDSVARRLRARFDIRMNLGITFFSNDYRPWLDEEKGDIKWYYWKRYERFLRKNRFPAGIIRKHHSITDQILDHLENPEKEGHWARKGMVVGHVQSGKTSNYIGLICKAADCGYSLIIVLAGVLNSLRNQTQERIEDGFIGRDISRMSENSSGKQKHTGVGNIDSSRFPVSFTNRQEDFRISTARQNSLNLKALNEPLVLVLKKNSNSLKNLIQWLKYNNPFNLRSVPLLLIDDEADHASINTRSEGLEATTINRNIRELIGLFDRSSYVGYTATPFANVFIDPDTNDEMLGDDLFPRDFIMSLEAPSNYVGPSHIFSDEPEHDILIEIDDYEDYLPLRHKKDSLPAGLPASLKEAIQCFVLTRAVRIIREQRHVHNSMMINVSRFTAVQTCIKLLVEEYLTTLNQAILNHYSLDESQALENSIMAHLKTTLQKRYSGIPESWHDVQGRLKDAVAPIGVIEVNSSSTSQPLDFSERNYPNGRNVIAVGGFSLSRGLTLEGLMISYFLRNSVMYDTLMQMGRWFGYRDGYVDLCRIFMPSETASWYGHIADVIEELRDEFRRMKDARMTPQDFGLCVRSHPESLIVTARNKMRYGKKVSRKINLEGRLVETSILFSQEGIIRNNRQVLEFLICEIDSPETYLSSDYGYMWSNISPEYITHFVSSFENHPASQLTESTPLNNYIVWLENQEFRFWDVLLVTPGKRGKSRINQKIGGYLVTAQERDKVSEYPGNGIALNKRRVASRGVEKAGLTEEQIERAEKGINSGNIPDRVYREVRSRPMLILHLLDCRLEESDSLFENGIVAYSISFPGIATRRRPEKLVEYVVNPVWWRENYAELLDEVEEE